MAFLRGPALFVASSNGRSVVLAGFRHGLQGSPAGGLSIAGTIVALASTAAGHLLPSPPYG